MEALLIVETEITFKPHLQLAQTRIIVQEYLLVLHRAPEPLNIDIVEAPVHAVHADGDAVGLEDFDKGGRGELTTLISIEDRRHSPYRNRFFQGGNTEGGIDGVRQLPRQYPAAIEIQDGHQKDVTPLEFKIGDVGGPDLVRHPYRLAAQEIRVDWMLLVRHTGSLARIDGPQAGLVHDAPNLLAADIPAVPPEFQGNLAVAVEGDVTQDHQDGLQDCHFVGVVALNRFVVVGRTADSQNSALLADG